MSSKGSSVVLHRHPHPDGLGGYIYETDDGYRVLPAFDTRSDYRFFRNDFGTRVHERVGWDVHKGLTLTVDESVRTLSDVRSVIERHREKAARMTRRPDHRLDTRLIARVEAALEDYKLGRMTRVELIAYLGRQR